MHGCPVTWERLKMHQHPSCLMDSNAISAALCSAWHTMPGEKAKTFRAKCWVPRMVSGNLLQIETLRWSIPKPSLDGSRLAVRALQCCSMQRKSSFCLLLRVADLSSARIVGSCWVTWRHHATMRSPCLQKHQQIYCHFLILLCIYKII